jgi:cell division protein FtsB
MMGAWLERLVPVAILSVAAASVLLMMWSPSGLPRLSSLQSQKQGLELEAQRIERDIERLRVQADAIKTSPASIERVARDELGLVRQTEVVVQFKNP